MYFDPIKNHKSRRCGATFRSAAPEAGARPVAARQRSVDLDASSGTQPGPLHSSALKGARVVAHRRVQTGSAYQLLSPVSATAYICLSIITGKTGAFVMTGTQNLATASVRRSMQRSPPNPSGVTK